MALIAACVAAALAVGAYIVEAATPAFWQLPSLLVDPVFRAAWLADRAAEWPFWLVLGLAFAVCVALLVRFGMKGRVR